MSFETNPRTFRIGIRGRGGELLSPSTGDFRQLTLRGDMPGLSLLYRMRRREEVDRLLTLLTGELANRVQFYWRQLIYQRAPAGATRSGFEARESRRPVNWRGDYARAVRIRRQRYSAQVYVDTTVSRFLAAIESGTRAIGERFFVGGEHNALDTRNYFEASLSQEMTGKGDLRTSRLSRQERTAIIKNRIRRIRGGEQGEGSARILEWARSRFGAGEVMAERSVTRGKGNRAITQRGVRSRTGIKKKETESSVNKNAYRLLIYIRTHGTKPVAVFSRLRNSIKQGGPLQAELDRTTRNWYESIRKGGELS